MPSKYTEEEKALLTDEELAGLEELENEGDEGDEGEEDDGAESGDETSQKTEDRSKSKDADAGGEDDADKSDKDESESEESDAEDADNEADAGDADDLADANDEGDSDEASSKADQTDADVVLFDYLPRPVPNWQMPKDAQATLTDLATRQEELSRKFDEGEIERAEFVQEQRTLDNQRQSVTDAVNKAVMARELAETEWYQGTVPAFLKQFPIYKPDTPLFSMLDAEVKKVQASGDFANPFDPKIWEAVHNRIIASIGLKPAAKEKVATTAKSKASEKVGKKVVRDLPPTLKDLPASANSETGDTSKWARIDRLEGEAFENALASLSDSEREFYLARD